MANLCGAELGLADDYGDNDCTFCCQESPGHKGTPHREEFERGSRPVIVTWWIDERRVGLASPGGPLSGYVKPRVTAEPAQHIPCEGVMPNKPIFCSTCGYTPHRCEACTKRLLGSDCFDPYEALDIAMKTLLFCGEKKDGEPRDGSVNLPWGDAETIRNQLNALRAYITGMEK